MARGISIHVGVNKPDPSFQMTQLNSCVNDAMEMQKLAHDHNFETQLFPDEVAKFKDVRAAILEAAIGPAKLAKGDIFLFTFSGHGSGVLRDDNEDDGQDEAILLHDCIVIDNYFSRVLWSKFDEGVRILGVADCCNAGSTFLSLLFNKVMDSVTSFFRPAMNMFAASPARLQPQLKELKRNDQVRIRNLSKSINEQIDNELATEGKDPKATILTLAACNDFENARDGVDANDNSAFTKAMLEVLGRRKSDPNAPLPPPPVNYDDLMTRISANLANKNITGQTPTRLPKKPNAEFVGQAPFTV